MKSVDGSPFIIDCGNSSNKTILNGLNLEVGVQIEQQQPQQDRDTALDKHTTSQNIELHSCTIVPGGNQIAINLKTISSVDTSTTTHATTTLTTCIKVNQCIMGAIRSNSKNLYLDLNRSIVHFSSSNSAELAIGPSQDAEATTLNPNEMPHKPIANISCCTIVGKCNVEKRYMHLNQSLQT